MHNLHVSIQEYQKKQKVFQKKVTKRRHQDILGGPEIQYMNIYKKTLKRLDAFEEMTDEFNSDNESEEDELFFGDATAYEQYLDSQIKSMNQQDQANKETYQNQQYNGGYQTNFNLSQLSFKPTQSIEALTMNLATNMMMVQQ